MCDTARPGSWLIIEGSRHGYTDAPFVPARSDPDGHVDEVAM
jgi:hypothetical protein